MVLTVIGKQSRLLAGVALVACSSVEPGSGLGGADLALGPSGEPIAGTPGAGGAAQTADGQTGTGFSTTDAPPPAPPANAGGAGNTVTTTMVAECAEAAAMATDTVTIVPADIIWAIDSSGSMTEELAFVQERMNAFSAQIAASGIDVRVVLVADETVICIAPPLGSGTCPADTNQAGGYLHVNQEVGSNDGLEVILASFAQYQAFLRPEATKTFVLVTDDDSDTAADAFVTDMTAALTGAGLGADFTFSAIYSFTECPDAAAIGAVYATLVPLTAGVAGDLCLQAAGFDAVFADLVEAVVASAGTEIACEWEFPLPPAGQTFLATSTEVTRVSATGTQTPLTRAGSLQACTPNGWYFDNEFSPTRLLACPDLCTALQAEPAGGGVAFSFGCEIVEGCAATGIASIPIMGTDGTTIACEWGVPPPPTGVTLDVGTVNVRLTNGVGVANSIGAVGSAADCPNVVQGWYYADPNNPSTLLACPQTCTLLQMTPGARIDVLFGCATIPAEPPIIQ